MKNWDQLSAVDRLLSDMERDRKKFASVSSPAEDVARSYEVRHALSNAAKASEMVNAKYGASLNSTALEGFKGANMSLIEVDRFMEPAFHNFLELSSEALFGKESIVQDLVRSAARDIKSPWIDKSNPLESIRGLAALVNIGKNLVDAPFSAAASEALRLELGDWRDAPIRVDQSLLDAAKRREVYYERGLNVSVGALPTYSFAEVLDSAHVRNSTAVRPSRSVVSEEHNESAETPSVNEGATQGSDTEKEDPILFSRPSSEMVLAFEVVYILERALRSYIAAVLERECGPSWCKRQVPADSYGQWVDRHGKAQAAGELGKALIDFAEMGDYPKIICNGGNWKYFRSYI